MKGFTLPKNGLISKELLLELYVTKKKSVAQISSLLGCSHNKINYWLAKYRIKKRTISEAIYDLRNPNGDPFCIRQPITLEQGILFGLGLGLYWGEGAKRGTGGVRLTNTDPKLIKKFIEFLEQVCGIKRALLKFSIQIFNDINPEKALSHWKHELKVSEKQFYKVIVSEIRGKGTYKYKSEYGVLMVYFNNVKLKRLICEMIEKIP